MPVISTNTAANTAVRFLNRNSTEQSSSLAKLASGSNINKASDDAAGLAISTKIGTDVAALEQASTNASHGISVLQTADGGASNIADIVERMKTLASQSASGTVTDKERTYIQAEFSQLKDEVDGITESTRYNGQSLLDGSSDFSVDDTKTAAIAHATDAFSTGSVLGTDGVYTNTTGSAQAATLNINGTTVDFGSLAAATGTLSVDEMAADINSAGIAGVTASAENGTLTIVSSENDLVIADGTGSDLAAADLGLTAATATLNAATADYTASTTKDESGTIMIDGTKVTLSVEKNGTLTADEMVTQINTALKEGGNYNVEASLNSSTNQLELTSITKGENATVTLANFDTDGGLSLATLGLMAGTTHGTTTEVASTGADIVVGSTSADTINLSIEGLTAKDLGIADLDVSTKDGADKALSVLDTAIDTISNARAEMGATMSRFEFRSAQIDTSVENLESAKSAIADVDIAKEQASLSSSTVKVQAAVAAASQANQMPQNLLSLIR
jgi:flagellin